MVEFRRDCKSKKKDSTKQHANNEAVLSAKQFMALHRGIYLWMNLFWCRKKWGVSNDLEVCGFCILRHSVGRLEIFSHMYLFSFFKRHSHKERKEKMGWQLRREHGPLQTTNAINSNNVLRELGTTASTFRHENRSFGAPRSCTDAATDRVWVEADEGADLSFGNLELAKSFAKHRRSVVKESLLWWAPTSALQTGTEPSTTGSSKGCDTPFECESSEFSGSVHNLSSRLST